MLIYKDGQVKHYKDMFPNVSFAASGPSDDFLADNGAVKVSMFKPHDRATQKLVPSAPYVEDGWAYTVKVADKTAEEIASQTASQAAQMRSARDAALKACDWRVIRAYETGEALDADWAAYRQALRDLPAQEGFPNVQPPHDPDYVPMEGEE
jgi:hypothetical protein